jgi:hypothetical protein
MLALFRAYINLLPYKHLGIVRDEKVYIHLGLFQCMFIDIVIPKNNESAFILMAKRLGIHGICFLYKGKAKDSAKGISGSYEKVNGVFVARIDGYAITFDAQTPDQIPQQGITGISFSSIASPVGMRNAARNIRLCRKGHHAIAVASLAEKPYEMRSPHDFASLLVCLGMSPGEAKKSLALIAGLLGRRNI